MLTEPSGIPAARQRAEEALNGIVWMHPGVNAIACDVLALATRAETAEREVKRLTQLSAMQYASGYSIGYEAAKADVLASTIRVTWVGTTSTSHEPKEGQDGQATE